MGFLLWPLILVALFFVEKNVNQKSAKKQRILISLALAVEIVANIIGYLAGNSLANNSCSETPVITYLAWSLAIIGAVLATVNLYIAIKGKQLGPIVLASLFILMCLVAAAFAWFISTFCLTF